eukprot:5277065-Amphidinium_carterae.1
MGMTPMLEEDEEKLHNRLTIALLVYLGGFKFGSRGCSQRKCEGTTILSYDVTQQQQILTARVPVETLPLDPKLELLTCRSEAKQHDLHLAMSFREHCKVILALYKSELGQGYGSAQQLALCRANSDKVTLP